MVNKNREFFATLGIILSWLTPLVVFFLFLTVPRVRDLLTAFATIIAVYSTFQFYRWGNRESHRQKETQITPIVRDSKTRIRDFLDGLSDLELDELNQELRERLSARDFEEKPRTEDRRG
jgi:hypothetical protein